MLVPTLFAVAVLAIAALILTAGHSNSAGHITSHGAFRRWLRGAMAVFCLALAALFAFAFYDRYWRWRDCFNELGRCTDPESQEVYLEQAGIVWGSFTILSLAGVLLLILRRRR